MLRFTHDRRQVAERCGLSVALSHTCSARARQAASRRNGPPTRATVAPLLKSAVVLVTPTRSRDVTVSCPSSRLMRRIFWCMSRVCASTRLRTGQVSDALLDHMCTMGFDREQSRAAIVATGRSDVEGVITHMWG